MPPEVSGNRVALASCSGLVVSYDRRTGERIWEYDVKADGDAQTFHGELARRDSSLFIAVDGIGGNVYRFDSRTGDVVWKWRSNAGVSSDLVLRGDTLVLVTNDNRLTTLDAATGWVYWQTEAAEGSRSIAPVKPTPTFLNNELIFGRADGRVAGYHLSSSEPLWETWLPAGVTTDLVGSGDAVILGTLDGSVCRLDTDGDIVGQVQIGATPTYRWMVIDGFLIGLTKVAGADRELIALDANTLEQRWRLRSPHAKGWTTAQPAWGWGSVIVGDSEPALYAVDPRSGEIRWRAKTDHPPRTVSVDGNELFMGTFGGTLDVYKRH
ncbi:MAG: PQQ-binding-like beta-propeller repeat protein [bacterium]